jgi:hypothetical protein
LSEDEAGCLFHYLKKAPATKTLSPVRASKRNVATMDQDSMDKVTKLNANKNLQHVRLAKI